MISVWLTSSKETLLNTQIFYEINIPYSCKLWNYKGYKAD